MDTVVNENHVNLEGGNGQPAVRRRKVTMANFRPKHLKIPRNQYSMPGRLGRRSQVDMFSPGHGIYDDSTVAGMSWTIAMNSDDKYQVTAAFASALGAYSPAVMRAIIPCLTDKQVDITTYEVPDEASAAGYNTEGYSDMFSNEELLVTIGISLILPFKHIHERNFENFMNARKKALGSLVGLSDDEIPRYRYPLDIRRCRMIQTVLAGNMEVKQTILKYVMWASEATGTLKAMARYVGSMLAWNEMNLIVFINNVFVNSKSPVLNHPNIQDELDSFRKIMVHILRSPCPSYFRHFCTAEEEQMLQRNNFQVLGAVAQDLLKLKSKNKSIENFAGTSESGGHLASILTQQHIDFANKTAISSKSQNLSFIFNEGDYEELLGLDEAEGQGQ